MKVIILVTISLLLSSPAIGFAAPKKIKGALTESGYQIFASSATGSSVSTRSQDFRLKANFKRGALSLVDDTGNVAGPIILAIQNAAGKLFRYENALSNGICEQAGTKAITGFNIVPVGRRLRRVLNLGTVTVDTQNGYGFISNRIRRKQLFRKAFSLVDSNCVPEGAGGKLGLSTLASNTLKDFSVPRLLDDADNDGLEDARDPDIDNDGIANVFDLDRNGDGILDFYQRDPAGNFISDGSEDDEDDSDDEDNDDDSDIDGDEYFAFLFSNLTISLADTLNLYTGTFTQNEIDTFVRNNITLVMGVPGDGEFPVETDCTGLSYCSPGGTGEIASFGGGNPGASFPDEFDADADGFGRIDEEASLNPIGDFFLKPRADTTEIKPGNVITQIFTPRRKEIRRPLLLEFVFNTNPAIKSLKFGETNPTTTVVSYPVASNGPGTDGNCFQHDSTFGQKVDFVVYRPQRPGIQAAGEAEFMDMGNLRIVASVSHNDGPIVYCPANSFSTTDPDLEPFTGYPGDTDPNQELGLLDTKGDMPFNELGENTLSFTLDLEACTGATSGTTRIDLKLRTPRNDNAQQQFCIERT